MLVTKPESAAVRIGRCFSRSRKGGIFPWIGSLILVSSPTGSLYGQALPSPTLQKISATEGGFTGVLDDFDQFGSSVASLGDLDGDGVGDLAVGAFGDDDGGSARGALWVLFLDPDGTVRSRQKISDTAGGFTGVLDDGDLFGRSVTSLGDLDGDGVSDVAVGAQRDDDGGLDRGALWVLFLNRNGTVKSDQKISDTAGGFTGVLDDADFFGLSAASLGDIDGDGVGDLAVGAASDDDGGSGRGAVWVLFLNRNGTVKSQQKISDTSGGFTGVLDDGDGFGGFVASLGDLDGDGVGDLAAGAASDDDGGSARGAVWTLFLNGDGTVKSHQKISDTVGGFTGVLDDFDQFGLSVASIGDLDGDGKADLAVGTFGDDDGGPERGALWVLFLNDDGTVRSHQKISAIEGGFAGALDDSDAFGFSVASLADVEGDGVRDLAVGAIFDDDGGSDRGALWLLFLDADGTVQPERKISDTVGGFTGALDDEDSFGSSIASIGDLDGDGVGDVAVGALADDDGGSARGALWVLFLDRNGTVKSHRKISDTEGGFDGVLRNGDLFGRAVASLGDLDGDGVVDLGVGAEGDDDGGFSSGAVWVLFLNRNGTVKSHQKISASEGGFTGALLEGANFGESVASLGDFDGDGVGDLAVGAEGDSDGGIQRGAVWVLLLNANGTVKSHQKISDTAGGFAGVLDDRDGFGVAVASLGDLDEDGVGDLAVGARFDGDGGLSRGAVWVLFLNGNGTVKSHQKISDTAGGFTGELENGDFFGLSIASLGDFDDDGVVDLAVGASSDNDGGESHGAVWLLFLNGNGTVKSHQKISDTEGGFTGLLEFTDGFGLSVAFLEDLDGDGVGDLAAGAINDDDGGEDRGAVWMLSLCHGVNTVRAGNVGIGNNASGIPGTGPHDVLRLDGQVGDPVSRKVIVASGECHTLEVLPAPGLAQGHYAVWIYEGESTDCRQVRFKASSGSTILLGQANRCLPVANPVSPDSCACPGFDAFGLSRSVGVTSKSLGAATAAQLCLNKRPGKPRSPTSFTVKFPRPGTYQVFGLVLDRFSINSNATPPENVSVANSIVVEVMP